MKIRIIASKPKDSRQAHIYGLYGSILEGHRDKDGDMLVKECPSFNGQIILNPGEYEILETKPSNEK